MNYDLDIDVEGLRAMRAGLQAMAEDSEYLRPVAPKLVRRATESERRLFEESPWAPRKPSTIDRYSRPLRSFADEQLHTDEGSGPLDRLGVVRRALSTPHAIGQRAVTTTIPGGLLVRFGVQSTGPAFYANYQPRGDGARLPRDPFRFDDIAHTDATADVTDHIIDRFGED